MITLHTLGSIRLTRADGTELGEVLRQPKRLALLAYLSSPRPGVWHRRDVLLAAFWPQLDTPHARTALRNALYMLRQHLEEGTVRTRGDEEVSIDPSRLTTDVAMLEADVAAGRFAEALRRYEGDALPGLHVGDAEGFETWLDEERLRTRGLARGAGLKLATDCEQRGDLAGAADALSNAAKLDPVDESVARRLIATLDRAGDHARALDVYERFRARLAEEFDAEPAAETVRLADAIRSRRGPASPPRRSSEPGAPDGSTDLTNAAMLSADPVVSQAESSAVEKPTKRGRRVAALATTAAVVGLVALLPVRFLMHASLRQTLLVLPMKNATGRSDLGYMATGIDDEIARRLRGIGGLETTKSAVWAWADSAPGDLPHIGEEFGARVAFLGKLEQQADSFVVTGYVIDIASGKRSDVGRYAFLVDQLRDVSSRVSAAIAGVMFHKPLPEMPRGRSDRVDPESVRLTMYAWDTWFGIGGGGGGEPRPQRKEKAKQAFLEAIARDPTNARAWAGLSSIWSSSGTALQVPFEEADEQARAAANKALFLDSLEGSAWLTLAMSKALRTRSVHAAEPYFARANAVDPGNAEIPGVKGAMYRLAWAWDEAVDADRIASRLEPMNFAHISHEADVEMCRNHPREALELYRTLERLLKSAGPHVGAARALARLEKWDEALAELEIALPAKTAADSALRDTLAKGEKGYWQLSRADAKRRLDASLARVQKHEWVSPVLMAGDRAASGDVDGGLDELAKLAARGEFNLYNVPCGWDEARSSPRFWQILESLPKWDLARPVPRP